MAPREQRTEGLSFGRLSARAAQQLLQSVLPPPAKAATSPAKAATSPARAATSRAKAATSPVVSDARIRSVQPNRFWRLVDANGEPVNGRVLAVDDESVPPVEFSGGKARAPKLSPGKHLLVLEDEPAGAGEAEKPAVALKLRLVDVAGQPVSRATVLLSGAGPEKAVTAREGLAEVSDLEPGRYGCSLGPGASD